MIKPYWTIRSLRKLMWGLSFAASGVTLLYAFLCAVALDGQIPWRLSAEGTASKWLLLVVPLFSTAACTVLYLDFRRVTLPNFYAPAIGGALGGEARARQITLRGDMGAGFSFFVALWCFLRSLNQTSYAKGLDTLPDLLQWAVFAAFVIYAAVMLLRIRKVGKTAGKSA